LVLTLAIVLWRFGSPPRLQTPKVEAPLGVKVHSLTLSFTPGLPLLARNLASPCLGCEPKAKVTTCCISTFNEWCLSWIFGWFHGLLHWWHPYFLEEHEGPRMPCTSCLGKALRNWTLCQIKKMWIPSIQSGFFWLYHL
jgi:hypothetical protein